jgi:hypothetical protein
MKKPIELSHLRPGPIRHPVLPDDFIERIKAFKKILGDADNASLEQTIDNFKRDTHPENELAIWERIASTFQMFLSHNPTADAAIRKDILSVLIGASTGNEEYPNIKHLSDDQIKHLVANFRGLFPS